MMTKIDKPGFAGLASAKFEPAKPHSDTPDPRYRPCVGIAVFNAANAVFIGRRQGGPEHVAEGHEWQMPQGGIDPGETPVEAAIREIKEETGITSITLLGQTPGWLAYELPAEIARAAWKGRYRGQTQKWFAFRFTGKNSEIDISAPGSGAHEAEFIDWRWERLERTPELVIPFKRPVYEAVAAAFGRFTG
jgi:putative (di)nucleoside polyphosphate hydrolase